MPFQKGNQLAKLRGNTRGIAGRKKKKFVDTARSKNVLYAIELMNEGLPKAIKMYLGLCQGTLTEEEYKKVDAPTLKHFIDRFIPPARQEINGQEGNRPVSIQVAVVLQGKEDQTVGKNTKVILHPDSGEVCLSGEPGTGT